jgi:hypothetical protein
LVDESWFHLVSFVHELDYTDDVAFTASDFYALCDEDYHDYVKNYDQPPAQQL